MSAILEYQRHGDTQGDQPVEEHRAAEAHPGQVKHGNTSRMEVPERMDMWRSTWRRNRLWGIYVSPLGERRVSRHFIAAGIFFAVIAIILFFS